MSFQKIADSFAETTPEAVFSTHNATGHILLYRELAVLSRQLQTYLLQQSLQAGDRIVLLSTNHWVFHPLLLACAAQNLVLVPVNPELHRDEIIFILEDAAAKLIIYEQAAINENRFKNTPQLNIAEVLQSAKALEITTNTATAVREDTVLIVYTSGTTGVGKGVMLSENNLLSMAQLFCNFYDIKSTDRFICILPIHHMNGIMMTGLLPLVAGAQTLLADIFSFKNAKFYWQTVAQHKITICSLVPSVMAMLLRLFPEGAGDDSQTVRHAFCGTAPLPADIWQDFEARFGFPVFQGYGLTETTTWVTCTPYNSKHRYDSVGVPLGSNIKLEPLNKNSLTDTDDTQQVTEGEILIKAPTVMQGYYKQTKLTEGMFKNGYLKSGDLGYFDEDGELHISGRRKEIIIRNGININPIEVDDCVRQLAEIAECKTVGLEDSLSGESITTVCVPLNDQTPPDKQQIKQWVRDSKSTFYCPDNIVFMHYLPKGPTGKVRIKELKKILTGEFEQDIQKRLSLRKYRRAQPSDPAALQQIIHKSAINGQPINLLTYWGCGKRDSIADVDKAALLKLKEMLENASLLEEVPCRLTIMLNDMHSTVNCVPIEHYQCYYGQIAEYARSLGFNVVYQSEIWQACELDIDKVLASVNDTPFIDIWNTLDAEMCNKLIDQAHKHFRAEPKEQGARNYLAACLVEAEAFANYYQDTIFISYNGPDFDICLPNMPKLYIFSYKKGSTEKPWFL